MRTIISTLMIIALLNLYAPSLRAHGLNPGHLDSVILNPFDDRGRITSSAPGHHTPYGGDLSVDVVQQYGETRYELVYFRAAAIPVGNYVRGRIKKGGANAPELACPVGGYNAGAYVVEVEIQLKTPWSNWLPIGWVRYAHLYGITRNTGEYIYSGEQLGRVSGKSSLPCSSAPHVHMEFYNASHYSGYVPRSEGSTFGISADLACVGGSRTSDQPCY